MNFQFICVDCGTINTIDIKKGVTILDFCDRLRNMMCPNCKSGFENLVIESTSIMFELDVARR